MTDERKIDMEFIKKFACRVCPRDYVEFEGLEDGGLRVYSVDGDDSEKEVAIYLSSDDQQELFGLLGSSTVPALGSREDDDLFAVFEPDASGLRAMADTLGNAFTFSRTKEGAEYWFAVQRRLAEIAEKAASVSTARDARALVAPFLAACPAGFGTVIGHLALQGKSTADAGVGEGRRLAVLAKRERVAETWVRAPEALRDTCDRVRSYPSDFLARHLGPASDGAVKLAA